MAVYKLEFKPMKVYGKEMLPPDRLQLMTVLIDALAGMIRMVEGVSKVQIDKENLFLLIEGNDAVEQTLLNSHPDAILTKLE